MSNASSADSTVVHEEIRVRGIVQGVGFRPFVYRLACDLGLDGRVRNDAAGVVIHVTGTQPLIDALVSHIETDHPPLARIERINRTPCDSPSPSGFTITTSVHGTVETSVAPDAATCKQCVEEIFDVTDRRHQYAFANCTHCGPRLSIVDAIPYDRVSTSMRTFAMCSDCRREYDDPADRRFHAQPNACGVCGPRAWIFDDGPTAKPARTPGWLAQTAEFLNAGKVVAIKGIGGFHLACDAASDAAVERLRLRKKRDEKPFALMARSVEMIREYCVVSAAERAVLESAAAPVVILDRNGKRSLASGIAERQSTYGFMLPYSPLHHLIMRNVGSPIVLTSGNVSNEPQCTDNEEALTQLADVADEWLLHDRDIVTRIDDSVVRIVRDRPQILRRSRGYAPSHLRLPAGFEDSTGVVGLGGELKNTFCIVKDGRAILSPHIGDLKNPSTFAAFRDTLSKYERLFEFEPHRLAVDKHPDYLSTQYGRQRAETDGTEVTSVQHHHAHIAACLADNGVALDEPAVLGIALDGLGLGDDGTLWGGEFLLANYCKADRVASFEPVPMPGGAKAILEPWRMAYAYLRCCTDYSKLRKRFESLAFFRYLDTRPIAILDRAMDRGINCPMTSGCGRVFDAVASIVGARHVVNYEAQGAIELEAMIANVTQGNRHDDDTTAYEFAIQTNDSVARISTAPIWPQLLADLADGADAATVAGRFHRGLANIVERMVRLLAERLRNPWQSRIALSGGVFQNRYLTEQLVATLTRQGNEVYTHNNVPANDGGLSLGQAVVAAAQVNVQR